MASNSLNQHEVAMLLEGSEGHQSSESTSDPDRSAYAAEAVRGHEGLEEPVVRMLDQIHEDVSKRLRELFAEQLRRPVQVKLLNSTRISFEEFALTTDNPTCLIVLPSCRFEQVMLLEIQHSILFPIIDALLGGTEDCSYRPRRPLTEIEKGVAGHLVASLLRQIEASWSPWGGLGCKFDRIENTALGRDLMDRDDSVLLVSMQLEIGNSRGLMQLCLPDSVINELRPMLSRQGTHSPSAHQVNGFPLQAEVNVVATLARSSMSDKEVNDLSPGDLLSTGVSADAMVELQVQDGPLFLGLAGAFGGCKAVKIQWLVQHQAPTSQSKAAS